MTLLLAFLLQDSVEMKDHGSFYLLYKPAAYTDQKPWPLVLHLEARGGKASDGIERWRDRGCLVLAPQRREMGREREAGFVRASLTDAKARVRVDPERVLLAGRDDAADLAASLAASDPELFAACAPFGLTVMPDLKGKAPPFHLVIRREAELRKKGREAASALANAGADVLSRVGFEPDVEDEPKVLEWFVSKVKARGDLEAADGYLDARRYLDASLVCLGLLDRGEDEQRQLRLRFRRIEAAGIVTLGSVEVALSDRKYLDAWLRCRDAAAEYAWLPVGEKIRKRLGELDSDARVRKAREIED